MECELSILCEMTGFSKKQISDWAKAGIIPPPVRIENRGRGIGKIVYYPDETLNRLLVLKEFPVSSVTKKSSVGIIGLGFILFIFGYNDQGIRDNVRKFIKQSAKNLLKSFRIIERKPQKDLIENMQNKEYELPEGVLNPMLNRLLLGYSKNDMKKIMPEDTSGVEYDDIFEFGLNFLNTLIPNEKNEIQDLAEMYPEEFRNQIINMQPIKEISKDIDNLTDEDFPMLQASYMLLIGLQERLGIPKSKIVSSFTKANDLFGYALMGYYGFKMFYKPIRKRKDIEEEFLKIPEKIKAVLDETAAIRKKEIKKEKGLKIKRL